MSLEQFLMDSQSVFNWMLSVVHDCWIMIKGNWILLMSFSVALMSVIVNLLNRIKNIKK